MCVCVCVYVCVCPVDVSVLVCLHAPLVNSFFFIFFFSSTVSCCCALVVVLCSLVLVVVLLMWQVIRLLEQRFENFSSPNISPWRRAVTGVHRHPPTHTDTHTDTHRHTHTCFAFNCLFRLCCVASYRACSFFRSFCHFFLSHSRFRACSLSRSLRSE
jgi:hypothetical protein